MLVFADGGMGGSNHSSWTYNFVCFRSSHSHLCVDQRHPPILPCICLYPPLFDVIYAFRLRNRIQTSSSHPFHLCLQNSNLKITIFNKLSKSKSINFKIQNKYFGKDRKQDLLEIAYKIQRHPPFHLLPPPKKLGAGTSNSSASCHGEWWTHPKTYHFSNLPVITPSLLG